VAAAKILAVKAGTSIDLPPTMQAHCLAGPPALLAHLPYWPTCMMTLPACLVCACN